MLRHTDFKDPTLDALFKAHGSATPAEQRFMHIDANGDKYLASVSAVGGTRAGVDWYLATLVPKKTLFATMKQLDRQSMEVLALPPGEFGAAIRREIEHWRRAVAESGARIS